LGGHSHGPNPSLDDLESATNSHYDLLASILGRYRMYEVYVTYSDYVWYHGEYVRITVIHCDYAELQSVAFEKSRRITVRNSNIPTIIPHIG
jgi:hypothetical protein